MGGESLVFPEKCSIPCLSFTTVRIYWRYKILLFIACLSPPTSPSLSNLQTNNGPQNYWNVFFSPIYMHYLWTEHKTGFRTEQCLSKIDIHAIGFLCLCFATCSLQAQRVTNFAVNHNHKCLYFAVSWKKIIIYCLNFKVYF